MNLRRLAAATCPLAIALAAISMNATNHLTADDTADATSPAKYQGSSESDDSGARFDYRVREDLFAGFSGDRAALDRGMAVCNETLKENPKHAEAMVWLGAAQVYLSGESFGGGDTANGMKYWTTGLKNMDDARDLEPDNIGVLIPRAAVLLPAGRSAPPAMGTPVLEAVRADFERAYSRQKDELNQLGEHPHGELRMGLADVYRLLGQPEKSKEQLIAVQKNLPGSEYADEATEWLAAKPDAKLAHNCIGCHTE